MLLIDRLVSVATNSASAQVSIHQGVTFFQQGKGVPSEIGIEYMGQTAALIAGYQLELGMTPPHVGFLLGTKRYSTSVAWFEEGGPPNRTMCGKTGTRRSTSDFPV